MVIYEVNLTINNRIFTDYYQWLKRHINDMLAYNGFEKAILSRQTDTETSDKTNLTVYYYIDTLSSLNHYLENHAATMRRDAIEKFADQFSATRRIFADAEVFQLNNVAFGDAT